MNVPNLRFGEFEDEWQHRALSEILARLDAGVSVNSTDREPTNGEFSVLKTSCVTSGKFELSERKAVTDTEEIKRLKEPLLDNSIIISRMNTPALVGANAYIKKAPENTFLPDRLWQVKLKDNKHSMLWLAHWLSNDRNSEQIRNLATGTSNSMKNITKDDVFSLSLLTPSIEEQQKIADFLSAVDEKITALTAQKTALTQYKQGMMQRIFAQTLRFKDDNGADYPDWKIGELKQFCQVNPKAENLPDEFIYIDLESVESGQLLKENLVFIEDAPSRAQRLLQVNDVLFQMVRPYQQNNLFFDKVGQYVASTGYAQIRTSENPKFLYYCLHVQEFVSEVMNRCTGTSYPAINSTDLETIEIAIPAIEEQTKIAQFLTELDDKINAVEAQIQSAQQWKQGLLQQMFV